MISWRDGELVPEEGAVSARDRGWLIGDAIFETILVERGAPAFLDAHLARLARGCAAMAFETCIDARGIREAIAHFSDQTGVTSRTACRITLSRVGGPRGLAPSKQARIQTMIAFDPAPAAVTPRRLTVSKRRRWSSASTNSFKCAGAYAENMLARADSAAAGLDDAIMLNEHGRVVSLSAANIFRVTDDRVETPPESEGALPGVVRGVMIEEARRLGLHVKQAPIVAAALATGTILATNSLIGVVRCTLDSADAAAEGDAVAADLIDAYAERLRLEFAGEGR